jgi:uncharacterized protein YigA (DUF484 family)
MRADEVARFLQDNPRFFDDYAELLAHLYIPHPHGGRAVSITERQILTLRDKTRQLESRLAELIRFGEENDAIGEKVHRLGVALIGSPDLPAVLRQVYAHLREDFAVPHVALRIWDGARAREGEEFAPVGDAPRKFVEELSRPYCGAVADVPVVSWFGEPGHVRSVAVVALGGRSGAFGALALGSEDAQRFYAEMGTLFLGRIGEIVSAALERVLA